MSVFGPQLTNLGGHGCPGPKIGRLAYRLMIPIEFTLALGGPSTEEFGDSPLDFQSCQQNARGIQLIVAVTDQDGNPVNVRGAGSLTIKLLAPDGTSADYTAVVLTNGLDGKLYYLTAGVELAQVGLYQIQAKAVIAGSPISTRLGQFTVEANVDNA